MATRFRTNVLSRWSFNALGFQRMAGYAFRESSFSQGAIATQFPHLANSLDFKRTKFAVVEMANFRFCKIAVLIDSPACHENVAMDISNIALGIGVMQAYAERGSVGIAQLKAEPAQKIPLRFRYSAHWARLHPSPCPRGHPNDFQHAQRGRPARLAVMFGPMICHWITSCFCLDQSSFSPISSLVNLHRVS